MDERIELSNDYGLQNLQFVRSLRDVPLARCFQARHSVSDRMVVVRQLPITSLTAGARLRFEYEANLLKRLEHNGILRPLHYGCDADGLQLVRPWFQGKTLDQEIGDAGLSIDRVLQVGCHILDTLQTVHHRGCLVRDLRPSHIFSSNAITVLGGYGPMWMGDFLSSDEEISLEFAKFASPEQAGSIEHDIGPASDMYGLGVVLYAALRGNPPFDGVRLGEILRQHINCDPDFSQFADSVPGGLIDIVERLLQKEPRDRYQSALSALSDLKSIQHSLVSGNQPPRFTVGMFDVRTELTDPFYVGRDSELGLIRDALKRVSAGASEQVLSVSPSGMGKTRLLRETARMAVRAGFVLFDGQCSNQVGQEPLAPLLQLVSEFRKRAELNSEDQVRMSQALENFREEVATAMPELARLFGWQQFGLAGPEELGEGRIENAFCEFIRNLGTPDCPSLVSIDDGQWLDEQSMRILVKTSKTHTPHLLLFCVTRPDSGNSGKLSKQLNTTTHIELKPLSEKGICELAESMAGKLPKAAIRTIWKYSEGSPFMANAVLRGMVESKVLVARSVGGWRLDYDRLSTFQTADDAVEVLAGRLKLIPAETRRLLSIAAVIGKDFDANMLWKIADVDKSDIHANLEIARSQRLIWINGNYDLAFVHDKIRETVVVQLTSTQLIELHSKIARYLQQNQPQRVFDLAYHFDAANLHKDALVPALEAAEIARQKFSLDSAERQLGIALRAIELTDQTTRHEIELAMSDVLMLQGRYDAANGWLERATKSRVVDVDTKEPTVAAGLAMKHGELAFKRGDKELAVEYFEEALTELGEPVCRSTWQLWRRLLSELGRQTLHSLLPRWFLRQNRPEITERDKMVASLLSRLTYGYWYTRDKYHTLWSHLRGMNHCENFAPSLELSQAYSEHAPVMSLLPWHKRGIAYVRQSLQIRKSFNDIWGQGQSRGFWSILLYSSSEFQHCIEQAKRAIDILTKTGDLWEVHIARYQLAASMYRDGQLGDAIGEAKSIYESASTCGDYQSTGNIVAVWARASMGDIPDDILSTELDRDISDIQRSVQVQLALGVKLFYNGQFERAAELFRKAIQQAEKAGVINTYISPVYPWYATALRATLEQDRPKNFKNYRRSLRRLYKATKKAVFVGRRFTNELPHALREYAAAAGMLSLRKKAARAFHGSLQVAQKQGASFESAQTLHLRTVFGKEFGWNSDQQIEEAANLLDQFRVTIADPTDRNSISLVDRFDSLLDAGRLISTSIVPQDIFAQTLQATESLLRGERTQVVLCDSPGNWRTFRAAGDAAADEPFDEDLVRQVVETRRAQIENTEVTNQHGVQRKQSGTFLCCPIFVNENVVACVYCANTRLTSIFGDNEDRIVTYLCSAAGAALEKADSFEQLQELNRNLEQTVADRTAAIVQRSRDLEKTANELRDAQVSLNAAKERAEAASVAKSSFLARMSHEIRTPITAVLGFTELMLRGIATSNNDQRKHLETIHSNGSHLLHLLNDLLDISKIEADRLETERIECVPLRLVADVVSALRSKATQKNIDVQLRAITPIPHTITSDPTRLRQIITNLLGNAIKFTEQGSIVVNVRYSGEGIIIEVIDSGIGMTESQVSKVFDPFTQADTSTTRRFGGTGLGLSISKQLSEALGGNLSVTSSPGVGSNFQLVVPCDANDAKMLNDEQAQRLVEAGTAREWVHIDLSDVRVLIVDDAETNRELLLLVLDDANAITTTATNGQEAIEMIGSGDDVDVVLMDMQMPVMDGLTATQKLRSRGCCTPIIALTANTMVGDEEECRKAGCTDYLSKPINVDDLLRKVNQWSHNRAEKVAGNEISSRLPTDFRRALAIKFLDRLESEVDQLRISTEQQDFEMVSQKGHWLKGTAATLNLSELAELGRHLEDAAKAERRQKVSGVIDAILAEWKLAAAEAV